MPAKEIKFGTSGWRGIISDDFTFENVRIVVQAIADFIKSKKNLRGKPVIVGGDARFLSEQFCAAAAEVLAGSGIKALVCDRDTPTPVISYEVIRRKAAGGINFTASHNPAEYSGIKFSPSWGGPATIAETGAIEVNIKKIKTVKKMDFETAVKKGMIKKFDPKPYYMKRIKEIVDFSAIKKSRIKVIVDPLYASARGYLDTLLKDAGADVTVINDHRDVLFGGFPPEPAEKNIRDLILEVKRKKAFLGVAADGDGDRYGVIDADGSYIPANKILPLLLDYLIRTRGWKGSVVRSVATSHMVDAVAALHNRKLYETPVGFKYIGEIMIKEDIVIGGEESNGLTVHRHIPEKDGIIACLLVVEMAAKTGRKIKDMIKELEKKTGSFYTARKNYRLTEAKKEKLIKKLSDGKFKKIGQFEIKDINTKDGFKYILGKDIWVMTRFSGTEPVVRLYAEAKSRKMLKEVMAAGEKFFIS
ncbi:MAG: phosphoglucomutase/phosphomannomutase family protein [bacterium]